MMAKIVLVTALLPCVLAYAPSGWRASSTVQPVSVSGVSRRRVSFGAARSLTRGLAKKKKAAEEEAAPAAEEEAAPAAEEEETTPAEEVPAEAVKAKATGDITDTPAFLQKKVDVLENEIQVVEAALADARAERESEWAEWGEQIEQVKKQFDSVKLRTKDQRASAQSFERAAVLRKVLPATENFNRAIDTVKPETDSEREIVARYTAIGDVIESAFSSFDVDYVGEIGDDFDPEQHQAVMMRPSDEFEENTVMQVFQKGIKIGDIAVRPAMVVVSSGED